LVSFYEAPSIESTNFLAKSGMMSQAAPNETDQHVDESSFKPSLEKEIQKAKQKQQDSRNFTIRFALGVHFLLGTAMRTRPCRFMNFLPATSTKDHSHCYLPGEKF